MNAITSSAGHLVRSTDRAPRQAAPSIGAVSAGLHRLMAISLAIYGSTLLIGFWVAYDRLVAVGRLGLLGTGLLLIGLLYWQCRGHAGWGADNRTNRLQCFTTIGIDSGLLAGGLGLLFLLTHNWRQVSEGDFIPLPQLTDWLQTTQPQWQASLLLHENLFAGALIILLPLAAVTLWQIWPTPGIVAKYWALGGVLIGGIALGLTFSRSAWMGLAAAVAVVAYLYWRTTPVVIKPPAHGRAPRQQRSPHSWPFAPGRQTAKLANRRLYDRLLIVVILGGLCFLAAITVSPTLSEVLLRPIAGTYLTTSMDSRLAVWHDSLALIGDYPFTGSGLGSTPMVLASYVYLLHVPYLNHAHSLYLQVAVEQGLPGLIGLLGLLAGALGLGWQWLRQANDEERGYAAAALTALIGMMIYGCTDAELYVGAFVPLLFLPVALLLACAPTETEPERSTPAAQIELARWIGMFVPLAALLLLFSLPGTPTRWQLNRATVAQTRAELGEYRWPTWPIQDAVRRSGQLDDRQWRAHYLAVLAADPNNAAAARRLGQIALSLGNYQQAEQWLTTAYAVAPQQRATRQLLGEVKALQGDDQAAQALWQTVDLQQGQLELRRWWYEQVEDAGVVGQFVSVMNEYGAR